MASRFSFARGLAPGRNCSPAAGSGLKHRRRKTKVFSSLANKFTDKPSLYYSMSIAATWAGVGSLLVGITMAQQYGIINK